jgi:hypothetical protein
MVAMISLRKMFSRRTSQLQLPTSINKKAFHMKLSDAVFDFGKALGSVRAGEIYIRADRKGLTILPQKTRKANIVVTIAGLDLLNGDIKLTDKAIDRIRLGGKEVFFTIVKVEQIKGAEDKKLVDFITDVAIVINRQHANYSVMAMGDKRRSGVTPDDKENVARVLDSLVVRAKESLSMKPSVR